MFDKIFNMFSKNNNSDDKENKNDTGENAVKQGETFVAETQFEKMLQGLKDGEIEVPRFFEILFNSKIGVLTSEDQVDKEKQALKNNPKLFSIFSEEQEPYIALFSDNNRAEPAIKKNPEFTAVVQLSVGDLLMNITNPHGIIINPYWDVHFMWKSNQMTELKRHMTKVDGLYKFNETTQEELVTLHDGQGKEIKVPKSKFREEILPKEFDGAKDDAERLYGILLAALRDGFFQETLAPARRLYEIDPIKERSTTILGISLLHNNLADEAETLYLDFLKDNKSATVQTNLAKVYDAQGKKELCMETLRSSLGIDPNQDNAVEWYVAMYNQDNGEGSYINALKDLASVEGSWKAQLFLAREDLQAKRLDDALATYKTVLELGQPIGNGYMMLTGDLGQNGYVNEIIDFALPYYKEELHGPYAGMNLIRACIETQRAETGLTLCDRVGAMNMPDLEQPLSEIKKKFEEMQA